MENTDFIIERSHTIFLLEIMVLSQVTQYKVLKYISSLIDSS